jgi:uncharacterized protein (TIGR03435 family)
MRNVNLISCVAWAYEAKEYQIAGPGWLPLEKYDIDAKAAGPVPMAQMRRMLQRLLRDRFQLRIHRETREISVYLLKTGRSGPKLHKADSGGNTAMRREDRSFLFSSTSLPQFADDLAGLSRVDRPVQDRTGIPGAFDFRLKFGETSEEMKRVLNTHDQSGDGPSLFTLIEEQLGLKLEAKRGPVEMFIIDHAEKTPTEN